MPTNLNASGSAVTLRRFTAADIPLAMELKNLAGWNQTEPDWAGYLEFEPEGCFVAELDGRACGTATAIRYGDRFGWIGMVLVHPDCRRFGIGTTLLRRVIGYLQQHGTGGVKLDATPMGRKVYVPIGFVDEYEVTRYEGVARASGGAIAPGIREMSPADIAGIAAFDAPIFGSERAAVLRSLSRRNPEMCFVTRDAAGAIAGYLIARQGQNAVQLGPWLARGTGVAAGLLAAFSRKVSGRRVFVDVPHPNGAGLRLVEGLGFTVQRGFVRMYLGSNHHAGLPEFVFGTSGAEKG